MLCNEQNFKFGVKVLKTLIGVCIFGFVDVKQLCQLLSSSRNKIKNKL